MDTKKNEKFKFTEEHHDKVIAKLQTLDYAMNGLCYSDICEIRDQESADYLFRFWMDLRDEIKADYQRFLDFSL